MTDVDPTAHNDNLTPDASGQRGHEEVSFSMRDDDQTTVPDSIEGVSEEMQAQADEAVLSELEEDLGVSDETTEGGTGVFAEIQGILAELHLTPRQVFQLLFFLVVIIGLIIFSFVYLGNFLDGGNSDGARQFDTSTVDVIEKPVVVTDRIEDEVEDSTDSEPGFLDKLLNIFVGDNESSEDESVTDVGNDQNEDGVIEDPITLDENGVPVFVDEQIVSAKVEIDDFAKQIIINVVTLGRDQELDSELSFYSRTFRRARNMFNTDVMSLLDAKSDRNAAFDEFLGDFKAAYAESLFAFEELRQETERLAETVTRLERERDFAENLYLNAQEDLASEQLPELLADYQTVAGRYTIARSEYKARELLFARYEESLPIIERKIEALEANEEAFVKGVQVIDFPDIGLDLIVPAE